MCPPFFLINYDREVLFVRLAGGRLAEPKKNYETEAWDTGPRRYPLHLVADQDKRGESRNVFELSLTLTLLMTNCQDNNA